ncbi:MAG: hypothetical protein GF307_13630 [candidate division Zixibacteria bacterium]|nr:hypothetical protein [candidate division Zixibacteria bacterium]
MYFIDIYIGGKDKKDWAVEGVKHYIKILKSYASINIVNFNPEIGQSTNPSDLLDRLKSGIPFILMDESGKNLDTTGFAKLIHDLGHTGGRLAVLIGGHSGFSKEIIKAAENVVSLSPMTFGHRLSLLVVLEQLYRAFDILSGGKYQR